MGGAQRAPEVEWETGVEAKEYYFCYKAWKTISVISGNAQSTPYNSFS